MPNTTWATKIAKECEMNTAKFKIEGMHCNGCARIIQSLLERKAGVRTVNVSFKESQARILYDTTTVAEDQLLASIEKAGYHVAEKS
jgi:copper chaperone CopZ